MLEIKNLHVKLEVEDKPILKGLDLTIGAGTVHAIMGPNGSGKSTLSYVLAGREGYEVTDGTATLLGEDLLAMEPEERAAAGLFLAFQYPVEIPGVGNMTFLRTAVNAQRKARGEAEMSAGDFLKVVREKAKALKIDAEMLKRPVNVGFSGGEKKRNEILQMAMLEPKMCILDETDSRAGRRCDETGVGRRERAARRRAVLPGHHALSTASGPYHTGCRAHHGRRAHREVGRAGTGAGGRDATAMPISWRRRADGAGAGTGRCAGGSHRRFGAAAGRLAGRGPGRCAGAAVGDGFAHEARRILALHRSGRPDRPRRPARRDLRHGRRSRRCSTGSTG